jgi:uncharacterized protein
MTPDGHLHDRRLDMSWQHHRLDHADALRAVIPPAGISADKVLDRLDEHALRFIEHATFVLVATWSGAGQADVSPKGDPAGFIEVIDDRTIAIPDRPGNGRIDTFLNVVERPSVGLLLLVPGILETCRISGRGAVTNDSDLLDRMVVQAKRPKLALVVEIDEVFVHCGKALRRGGLWDPDHRVDRDTFPTMGQMLHDHARPRTLTRRQLTDIAEDDLHNNMY